MEWFEALALLIGSIMVLMALRDAGGAGVSGGEHHRRLDLHGRRESGVVANS